LEEKDNDINELKLISDPLSEMIDCEKLYNNENVPLEPNVLTPLKGKIFCTINYCFLHFIKYLVFNNKHPLDKLKVPMLNLENITKSAGHSRHKSLFTDLMIDQPVFLTERVDPIGVVPATVSNIVEMPSCLDNNSKTSRNNRKIGHTKSLSHSFVPEEFTNDIKNEAIVDGLFGQDHSNEIDKVLQDDSITQRRKEDMLFSMFEQLNLEDDDLNTSIEGIWQYQDQQFEDIVYKAELKTECHASNLICGKVLSKIIEDSERCGAVVLKLIDVFLQKNNHTVMNSLVYKFLNIRVWKDYGLDKVKEMIRQSNPRQKLFDDVREMHYITDEDLEEYSNQATVSVHESMLLYPVDQDNLINEFEFPSKKSNAKVFIVFVILNIEQL
jgi:hypothetical protein